MAAQGPAAMPAFFFGVTEMSISLVPRSERPRAALRLVSTREMNREQWLEVRRGGVGSSDAAAAVGLNPYKSMLELWMEKTGQAGPPQPEQQDDSSPTYWGTLLEPIVAAHYTRRTGNRVRRVNAVLAHPEHPWMLANIDREVVGAPDVQILECKTAGINGARLWDDGVPEYVQLQVLHQLAVTGKQAADVAVLVCGQELRIHRIERGETMISQLIALEAEFWQRVLDQVAPEPDGSDSADRALRHLYPRDAGSTVDFSGQVELEAAFGELVALRNSLETQGARANALKQQIQQRMGTATKATFSAGWVTWKRTADSIRFDVDRLAIEHPDLYAAYQAPKEGSRRFLIHEQPQA
jgi:putative phage-type endonuclease